MRLLVDVDLGGLFVNQLSVQSVRPAWLITWLLAGHVGQRVGARVLADREFFGHSLLLAQQ